MIDHRLSTFVTLAQLRNYTKTAEVLNLTQPAVSQHIQYLERYYKVPLVVRDRRGVYLTAEGELLLEFADKVHSLATGIKRTLQNTSGIVKKYRIGATLTIGEYVLPHLLGRHKRENPQIDISMCVQNTEATLNKLENEEIDLGVVEGPFNQTRYEHTLLKQDLLVLAVSPQHPLADKPKVDIEDLRHEKLILREKGSGTRTCFERALFAEGYTLKDFPAPMEIGNLNAIRTLVLANLGVTVISKEVVAKEMKAKTLQAVPITGLNLEREFRFVYFRRSPAAEFLEEFIDFCTNQIKT